MQSAQHSTRAAPPAGPPAAVSHQVAGLALLARTRRRATGTAPCIRRDDSLSHNTFGFLGGPSATPSTQPPVQARYPEVLYRQPALHASGTPGTGGPPPRVVLDPASSTDSRGPDHTVPAVSAPQDSVQEHTSIGHSHAHSDVPGHSSQGSSDPVADALARAQQALSTAEESLQGIPELPSAQLPSRWPAVLHLARTAVGMVALGLSLVASHAFGLVVQWAGAMAGALGIAWWGYTRQSLSRSGALAALAVGAGTLGCSLRMGATLLAFFIVSSKLTKYKEEEKSDLDDAAKAGGQRDWKQVFCNGAIPTVIAVAYGVIAGCVDVPLGPSPQMEAWKAMLATLLGGAYLGYYACCCGDTWASELGPLSPATPRLITTMRPVRKGTNGGVTWLGLGASVLGGAFMGAVFYAAALVSPTLWILDGQHAAASMQWLLIPLGTLAGLVGSVLDSVLGATLQYSGFNRATGKVTSCPGEHVVHISGRAVLSNNAVNMLSATGTAMLTAVLTLGVFGF